MYPSASIWVSKIWHSVFQHISLLEDMKQKYPGSTQTPM